VNGVIDRYWYMRLEDVIVGVVKDESSSYLSQFTDDIDAMFVTQESNPIPSSFPCVQFQQLAGVDRTNTLDRSETVAIMYSMQVRVYSETSEIIARSITEEICDQMKKLQFNMVSTPVSSQSDNLFVYTVRFRRMIAAGDDIVK